MATLPLCRQIGNGGFRKKVAKWQRGNGGFDKGLPKCGKVAKLLFWHMPTYDGGGAMPDSIF